MQEQKELLESTKQYLLNLELEEKDSNTDIRVKESNIKLSNNKTLKKYKLTSGFHTGISNISPGSGYIDFHNDNIFIISSCTLSDLSVNSNVCKLSISSAPILV